MAGVRKRGMRTGRRLLGLGCVSVLVLAGCGTSFEEDQPTGTGEGAGEGTTLVAAITEGDPMDWDPSVDNEKASIHFGDTLTRFDPESGETRWRAGRVVRAVRRRQDVDVPPATRREVPRRLGHGDVRGRGVHLVGVDRRGFRPRFARAADASGRRRFDGRLRDHRRPDLRAARQGSGGGTAPGAVRLLRRG